MRMEELPAAMAVGLAVMVTVGGGFVEVVMVTVAAAETSPETLCAVAV